jgi:nicotinate-nucleotide--dimethylbenzimidazole phosphoribosyltransferase
MSDLDRLGALADSIAPADQAAARAAQDRLNRLTKPTGSLGQIEALIVRMAAASGRERPRVGRRALLLAAADHGVAAEGVSAYPQAVTAQMLANYLRGGAAINALAAAAGARLVVVDAGVAAETAELAAGAALRRLGIRRGSGNIAREPAMRPAEALAAMLAGAEIVDELWRDGLDLLALGEMGIANTTPAAALTSALAGVPPARSVGRGTGIDDASLARKVEVVGLALARSAAARAAAPGGLAALAELGGLEIAVLAGATLAAAARRVPVLLDGYITAAAALVAAAVAPAATGYLLAAHCSAEPGHALALAQLGLTAEAGAGPLLRLDLRLGEGSGAALAMPLLVGAARLMDEMATFGEAGVDDRAEGQHSG